MALEILHHALPARVVRPRVLPDVKLQKVDRIEPQVLEARFRIPADVVRRKHVVQGELGA
jgi:hypothetical protein